MAVWDDWVWVVAVGVGHWERSFVLRGQVGEEVAGSDWGGVRVRWMLFGWDPWFVRLHSPSLFLYNI